MCNIFAYRRCRFCGSSLSNPPAQKNKINQNRKLLAAIAAFPLLLRSSSSIIFLLHFSPPSHHYRTERACRLCFQTHVKCVSLCHFLGRFRLESRNKRISNHLLSHTTVRQYSDRRIVLHVSHDLLYLRSQRFENRERRQDEGQTFCKK